MIHVQAVQGSAAVVACALAVLPTPPGEYRDREDPAVIREWNLLAEGVIPASAGPTLPRTYAMMHIAMFDAVNSIEGGYTAYRTRVPATRFASSEAAAAQAAHDVLVALWPANTTQFDTALQYAPRDDSPVAGAARCAGGQGSREKDPRVAHQRRLGDAAELHAAGTAGPVAADAARPSPPLLSCRPATAKPFALPTPYYYLPRRPPALNSQEYADAVNEIKAIGGATSTVRTDEQTLQARLWASVGYKENWGGVWNQVTRFMALSRNLSLIESARLFALVNVSMQDGVQTAQASKFVYQLWRPVPRHPARRRGHEPRHRCGSDLDAAANYAAVPVVRRQHGLHRREHRARAGVVLRHQRRPGVARSGPAPTASTTWRVASPASGSLPSTRARAANTAASTTTSTPRPARKCARRWPITCTPISCDRGATDPELIPCDLDAASCGVFFLDGMCHAGVRIQRPAFGKSAASMATPLSFTLQP